MLQWQWTLRHKGWRDQDPSIELAAKIQGDRVTDFIRLLRRREPWLSWHVVEGTEDVIHCPALGILCVPPPPKPWKWHSLPVSAVAKAKPVVAIAKPVVAIAKPVVAIAKPNPSRWCPVVPPTPAPSEAGRPRGGRFFEL